MREIKPKIKNKLIKSGKNFDKILMKSFKPIFDWNYNCEVCGNEISKDKLGSYWVDSCGNLTEPICKKCNKMIQVLTSERIQKICSMGKKEMTDKCYSANCPKLEECKKIIVGDEMKKVVTELCVIYKKRIKRR